MQVWAYTYLPQKKLLDVMIFCYTHLLQKKNTCITTYTFPTPNASKTQTFFPTKMQKLGSHPPIYPLPPSPLGQSTSHGAVCVKIATSDRCRKSSVTFDLGSTFHSRGMLCWFTRKAASRCMCHTAHHTENTLCTHSAIHCPRFRASNMQISGCSRGSGPAQNVTIVFTVGQTSALETKWRVLHDAKSSSTQAHMPHQ